MSFLHALSSMWHLSLSIAIILHHRCCMLLAFSRWPASLYTRVRCIACASELRAWGCCRARYRAACMLLISLPTS